MKKTANIILSLFLFFCASAFAQKDNIIKFEVVNGEPKVKEDSTVDVLGYNISSDLDDYDNITYNGPTLHFLYFENMAGYGLYNDFNVMSIHYKHLGPVQADTLLLTGYCHPANYRTTSDYGWRKRRMHYGVDLGYPVGTPVRAAFDGTVRISQGNAGGYGNLVVIRHNNGLETYYGHLSKRMVNPGQEVKAGDTIGLGGNTGRSYGSHLHFETRYLGKPFNPNKIVDFEHFKLKQDTVFIGGCSAAEQIMASTSTRENNEAIALSENPPKYCTVKNGYTLSYIAKKYGTSVSKIKKLNGLRSDFIREGQRLRVR
jgi:murein DD-endopeptidase MepM/ murein hydrolase activator NlpD